jgi:acetylornithine/succinyldiaminopimelate/putrescine aminotransferase
LIADEIQCGLGRTGRGFGYQRHIGLPDIAVVAKPLAGGVPLGAILAQESFAEAFSPGLHGSTFGGGPLACAMALEFLAIIEDEDLLENVRERGAQLRAGLSRFGAQFDFVREVRGEGLMLGLDLTVEGRPFVDAALRRGLILNCTHDHVLRLLPPFIVSERQVEDCLTILRTVFAETKRPPNSGPQISEADSPWALIASR